MLWLLQQIETETKFGFYNFCGFVSKMLNVVYGLA